MLHLPLLRARRLDGARVLTVADVPNPYRGRAGVQPRFARALNKLLAWRLTEYARVVQLDADNLFLRNVDELFACGDFCAVFINPCIFHTGLMVLKVQLLPSNRPIFVRIVVYLSRSPTEKN